MASAGSTRGGAPGNGAQLPQALQHLAAGFWVRWSCEKRRSVAASPTPRGSSAAGSSPRCRPLAVVLPRVFQRFTSLGGRAAGGDPGCSVQPSFLPRQRGAVELPASCWEQDVLLFVVDFFLELPIVLREKNLAQAAGPQRDTILLLRPAGSVTCGAGRGLALPAPRAPGVPSAAGSRVPSPRAAGTGCSCAGSCLAEPLLSCRVAPRGRGWPWGCCEGLAQLAGLVGGTNPPGN